MRIRRINALHVNNLSPLPHACRCSTSRIRGTRTLRFISHISPRITAQSLSIYRHIYAGHVERVPCAVGHVGRTDNQWSMDCGSVHSRNQLCSTRVWTDLDYSRYGLKPPNHDRCFVQCLSNLSQEITHLSEFYNCKLTDCLYRPNTW